MVSAMVKKITIKMEGLAPVVDRVFMGRRFAECSRSLGEQAIVCFMSRKAAA